MDWWAVAEDEWVPAISAAYAVLKDRKARRGAMGLSTWRGTAEPDPIVTLYIEEATTVLESLSRGVRAEMERMAREIAREGRKFGVRFGQAVQDPMGTDTLGGRKVKGLLSGGGTVVGHRPGDKTAAFLSIGSTSEKLDLTALPPEPGWAAVIRRGQVLARACRIRHASEATVAEALDGFAPRSLTGADAAAAGTAYAERTRGVDAAARMRAARVADTEQTAREVAAVQPAPAPPEQSPDTTIGGAETEERRLNATAREAAAVREANRAAVLDRLRQGPATRAELVTATRLGRTTIGRILDQLTRDGHAVADEDHRWQLATEDPT